MKITFHFEMLLNLENKKSIFQNHFFQLKTYLKVKLQNKEKTK